MKKPILYSFFSSSASYRVRIALHLKKIDFEYRAVDLTKGNGEQHDPEFLKLNPMGEVPCLIVDDGGTMKPIGQSMAILVYLDQMKSEPRLFPKSPYEFSKMIQFCENINSGIHPIQNLKVRQEIEKRYGADAAERERWCGYWIERGFRSIEKELTATAGQFCFGDSITAADLFLVPQVMNARRFKVDLAPFPLITKIDANCTNLESFKRAHPSAQVDSK